MAGHPGPPYWIGTGGLAWACAGVYGASNGKPFFEIWENSCVTITRGILPALATPIDASGVVQTAPLEALIAHLYGTGVHGL